MFAGTRTQKLSVVTQRIYYKDLGFRETDRSIHDCAALAQWMAWTVRSLSLCLVNPVVQLPLRGVRGI